MSSGNAQLGTRDEGFSCRGLIVTDGEGTLRQITDCGSLCGSDLHLVQTFQLTDTQRGWSHRLEAWEQHNHPNMEKNKVFFCSSLFMSTALIFGPEVSL
uniref:Uncharacterized protein n=1 Tax=Poecilia latipinna TaxID=48699 RepID=A0A3B3VVI6_9TELE